jgi:hypothetical protein
MKSAILFLAVIGAAVAAAPEKPAVQAQLLDSNQYLCSNCFFGASTYYYCFEADKKVLIGYEKVPTLNWRDPASNDLVKLHKSFRPLSGEGQTVELRYDDKHIWVTRPGGKTVRLKQDYSTDIFLNNAQCRSAVKKKD